MMIEDKIQSYLHPKRIALTRRYPWMTPSILFAKRASRRLLTMFDPRIAYMRNKELFISVITRHSSPLRRTLGNSDPQLQEQKVTNLKIACSKLDGVIIPAGKIFSLWDVLGNPTYRKGYVDGMLLSNGKVLEGVGGGLCQLSNLLHWAFLHTPLQIVERAHHSFDAFPDSSRTLPFGSGATIFYNLIDLRVHNPLPTPIQIHVWVDDKALRVQLRSPIRIPEKFHVYEREHLFIHSKAANVWFRSNEIWRQTLVEGVVVKDEKICENFAPVMYEVTSEYLNRNSYHSLTY